MKVKPGDLLEVRIWIRDHAEEVRRLQVMGDREAARVEFCYRAWWGNQLDVHLQNELIIVVKNFVARKLYVSEARELARRFGVEVIL